MLACPTTKNAVRTTFLTAGILMLGIARTATAAICLGCPSPDPIPPPPPSVSVPHIAFQFASCPNPIELSQTTTALKDGLVAALKQLDLKQNDPAPNPEIRTSCVNGIGRVGAWAFQPLVVGSWDTATARNVGLSQVNLLQPYEKFAFRVSRDGIDILVDLAWRDVPWTYNMSGVPDPGGAIHLDDFEIGYYDSVWNIPTIKYVETLFNGHVDGPFTQIEFFAGVGDYLWLNRSYVNNVDVGRIVCVSNPEFQMETTLETILATVFGLLHDAGSYVAKFTSEGPACRIARMLPQDILVGTGKITFDYQRLNVGPAGIVTGGMMKAVPRTPSVTIQGPSPLIAEYGEPATGTYTLDIKDMRPPYKVTWTANGVTSTNVATSRTITWNLGSAKPVSYVYRNVAVTVVDADGLQASTSKTFSIKLVWDPDAPPICHTHPYLPECQ